MAGELEIRDQLRFVDCSEAVDRLQLDRDGILNDQVKTVSGFQFDLAVDDRQGLLAFDLQTPLRNLECKARLVSRLQQTRPERAMHLDCGANNIVRDPIKFRPLFSPNPPKDGVQEAC